MMPAHNPSPRQLTRRGFCAATLATMGRAALAAAPRLPSSPNDEGYALVARTDGTRILAAAESYVSLPPRTITSYLTPAAPAACITTSPRPITSGPTPPTPTANPSTATARAIRTTSTTTARPWSGSPSRYPHSPQPGALRATAASASTQPTTCAHGSLLPPHA